MLSIVLMAALAAAPSVGVASPDLGGFRVPQYSGSLDWSRSWATDWGVAAAGMPAPTIAYEAASSGGDLTCTGATATKVGSPTTTTASGYPARNAVGYAATGTCHTIGTFAPAGSFTACAAWRVGALNASRMILGQYAGSNEQFAWYTGSTGPSIRVELYKAGGSKTTYQPHSLTAGMVGYDAASCVAYQYVADGSSVLRSNLNGAAATENTTAVGPMRSGGENVWVIGGGKADCSLPLASPLSSVYIWDGVAATAAQLATLVASQQARLASKPIGAAVTVSSPATTCIPDGTATGTLYNLPANSLCARSSGVDIYGAAEHSNLLAYSSPAAWTLTNVTGDDVSASCPLWVDGTTRMDLLTSTDADPTAAIDAANSRCRCVWLALPTGDSAHDVTVSDYSGDGGAATTLSATPTRVCATATGHTGIKLAWTHGANRVCAMRGVGQNTTVCGVTNPAPQAAGSPVSGTADAPYLAAQTISDTAGAIGVRVKTANTTDGARIVGLGAGSPLQVASSTSVKATDGTNTVTLSGLTALTTEAALVVSWSGSTMKLETLDGSAVASGAYDGSWGTWTNIYPGSNAGTANHLNGSIRVVCQAKTAAGAKKCLRGIP